MANGVKSAFVIILDATFGEVIIPLKEESCDNINKESFFEFLARNPARTNNVCWDCKLEHDAITLINWINHLVRKAPLYLRMSKEVMKQICVLSYLKCSFGCFSLFD